MQLLSLRRAACGILAGLSLAACQVSDTTAVAQAGGDWPQYRGDYNGTGFSPLAQITPANVLGLESAWSYPLAAVPDGDTGGRGPNSQVTPIVVGGSMYLSAADRVVALDPVTGEERWRHTLADGAPSRRGVSYWAGNANNAPRIYFTAGTRLVALDAASGARVPGFGQGGEIDMGTPYISVPLVYEDIIVVGANTPSGASGGIGNARAFAALNGEKIWEFSSVPQPGSLGHETWEADSWVGRLGVNAWPFYFTVDAERDLVFLPLASPLPFAWGGDRAGDNLFANSLVAVNIHSGDYAWHFQTIHHDLWDHDPPAAPSLFEIERDGQTLPAMAVTTKSGYLFLLNRETGEPLIEVNEQRVPQSRVPGEQTSPTQPIPRTPPLARVGFEASELVTPGDTSAAHAQACRELLDEVGPVFNAGAYTPWTYKPSPSEGMTTLLFPGLAGGPNWGGAAHDPATGYVFIFAGDTGSFGWLEDAPAGSDQPYSLAGPRSRSFAVTIDGMSMPCQQPPWGSLTAVDTRSGAIAWRRPLGVTEALEQSRQDTGRPGRAGALITGSGLLFIAATDDNRFRALEASSGQTLWETTLPNRGNANPMSYRGSDGAQYVVISATDELLSFRLR